MSQKCIIRARIRKTRRNIFRKNVIFIYFFGLWTEKLQTFTGKFWPEFRKTFYVSRGLLAEQLFWMRLFKKLGFKNFKWSFTDSGENFFQGFQNCNKCPEEQIEEKPFRIEKKATTFKILNELSLSFFWCRSLVELSKLQFTSPWKFLKKNIFFDALYIVSNLFGLWAKKIALVEKFPSGLSQLPSAHHSNNLKKIISFSI